MTSTASPSGFHESSELELLTRSGESEEWASGAFQWQPCLPLNDPGFQRCSMNSPGETSRVPTPGHGNHHFANVTTQKKNCSVCWFQYFI
jgi:hypothetical protein